MVISKFKSILTMACCFIVSLCLEIKSVDSEHDSTEVIQNKSRNASHVDESYCSGFYSLIAYPIKSSVNFSNNFISFIKKNPTYSVILGMMFVVKAANAVVPCYCYCTNPPMMIEGYPSPVGLTNDLFACQKVCTESAWGNVHVFDGCDNIPITFEGHPACGNYLECPSSLPGLDFD